MQMAILCGGLATRLGSIAKETPKSMIKIQGRPFLEHQLDFLKKNSIKDIVLCVGHLSDQIQDYFGDGKRFGLKIRYSHDGKKRLGPIGAVKNAKSLLDDVFFIMYGDSYLRVAFKEVYSYFLKKSKLGLMCVYKNNNKYDKSNIVVKDNFVKSYNERENPIDMIYIDYGTSIFRKESLERVPNDTFFTTGEFFVDLIKDHELLAYEVKERFYHIGNPDALEEFKAFITGKGKP
jgi:NDP-sugar pyrophosphorylase family protein